MPTSRDRGMDKECRRLVHIWLSNHLNLLTADERETLYEIVDNLPRHPIVDNDDFGSFGNINTIMGLAAHLDVSVVCWNKTTMRCSNAKQQVIVNKHDGKGTIKEEAMTPDAICALSKDKRVMHIEWDGENHYAALVGPTDVPINMWVHKQLMLAPPVTDDDLKRLKPTMRKAMPNVRGWMHLVDLYRTDLTLVNISAFHKKKSVKELLELAQKKRYHGVIYFRSGKSTNEARYLKFKHEASLTASDFLKAGDFSCDAYIDKKWLGRNTTAMPPDPAMANCPCHTLYTRRVSGVECAACNKLFHACCVGVSDTEVTKTWICLGCAQ
eukprot:542379-Prymnesium_polylepis.2